KFVYLLHQVIAALIQYVDGMFYLDDLRIGCVGVPCFVLFMPKVKIGPMLRYGQSHQTICFRISSVAMPGIRLLVVHFCQRYSVKHPDLLPLRITKTLSGSLGGVAPTCRTKQTRGRS